MSQKTVTPDQLAAEIAKDMDALVRGIAIESQARIINKMPVDSGALRASTTAAINGEAVQYSKSDLDPSGESTKRKNEAIIMSANAGDVVNIIVGAPYGQVLEEGDSDIRPHAFIRSTAEELPSIMAQVESNIGKYRK